MGPMINASPGDKLTVVRTGFTGHVDARYTVSAQRQPGPRLRYAHAVAQATRNHETSQKASVPEKQVDPSWPSGTHRTRIDSHYSACRP